MAQNVALTLQSLRCIREKNSPSAPYIWTAFLWIDNTTASVGVLTPLAGDDRVVLSSNLQPGQSVTIPASVGVALRPFDTDLTETTLIQVTALWQKHDTPANGVGAGFQAFGTSLHDAIAANLLSLASPDPQTQQQAVAAVKKTVEQSVRDAISNSLSTWQKVEFGTGLLTPDAPVDSSSAVFRNIASQPFTITLGGPLGGRLLSYGDAGTPGNVSAPVVVGFGGWADFRFLFAGKNASGEDRIYAVDQAGQLLSYGDAGTPGNVSAPVVVGFGGWADFKFLFAGKNASGEDRIYAVDQAGQLLSYGDAGTPGNVSAPVVVGFGGWADFKFLFAGKNASGESRIYAVEDDLSPDHHYEIDGTLQVTISTCDAEIASVSAALQAVSDLKSQIAELQSELSQASSSERAFLLKQIRETQHNLAAANATLDAAKQALAACRARNPTP